MDFLTGGRPGRGNFCGMGKVLITGIRPAGYRRYKHTKPEYDYVQREDKDCEGL